jgi:hypothetical protein
VGAATNRARKRRLAAEVSEARRSTGNGPGEQGVQFDRAAFCLARREVFAAALYDRLIDFAIKHSK